MVLENFRAVSRAHAGDVLEILDRNRQPAEDRIAKVARAGPFARTVETQGRQRIELAVDLRDAGLQRIQRVGDADFSGLQQRDDCARAFADQFIHVGSP